MAGCGATGEQTHPGDFRSWESPQTLRALFIGPFEHVERFRNLKFAVITRGGALRSFSYGYVPTWCSNPALSKIFLDTKILPCLKY